MPQKTNRPYTFDRVFRMHLSALTICGGLFLLYLLRNILLPFFIAWLLAYLLNPIVRFLKKHLKLANGVAVITTLIAFFGSFFLIAVLLAPHIQEEINQINILIYNYEFRTIGDYGIPLKVHDLINQFIDFKEIQANLSAKTPSELFQYFSPAFEKIFSNTINVLLGITVIFIILLYLIFILLDYEKINEFWRILIHPKYRPLVARIAADVEKNMNAYFRYQALICLILAVLYSIGFQLIGLPMAIVFGIFVGFIHMIPYLQVISFPPALLLCWLGASQSDATLLGMVGLTALVYVVIQVILDLFLVPRIMGRAMGLNPAIILLSLSIWGFFLGIVGMIIAIPLTTLLLSYYRNFLDEYELSQDDSEEEKLLTNKEG